MSQWGKERHFIMPDDGVMSVIAHVEGPTWEPLHPNHKIDDLIMSNCSSDIGVAQIILTDLKNTWIGRTHQEWCNSAKPVESITQLRPGTIIPTRQRARGLHRDRQPMATTPSPSAPSTYQIRENG